MNSVAFLSILLFSIIGTRSSLGLECYSCIYENINGTIYGDQDCKDGKLVTEEITTLKPCSNSTDALNTDYIEHTEGINPETKFRYGCVRTEIKKDGQIDIIIRGCYAKEIIIKPYYPAYGEPSTTPPPEDGIPARFTCGSPGIGFWKILREGKLTQNGTMVDTTSAKLASCFCDDSNGCNSAPSVNVKNISTFLLLANFVMISLNRIF